MSKSAHLVKKVIDEYLNQNLFARNIIMAELNLLLFLAIRSQDLAAETRLISNHQFAQTELEQYIDAHFTDVSLNDAAKYFGFNPNYFSSLVKQKRAKVLWNMLMKGVCRKREVCWHARISLLRK
ncbi:hypothetical protein SDC49_20635 [Lactobacillus sp. R2/2]|nr:hypothetical protein [Lactobacillus sp. R2/2]